VAGMVGTMTRSRYPEAGDNYVDRPGNRIYVNSVGTNPEGEVMVGGIWFHRNGPSLAHPWEQFYKTGGDFEAWLDNSGSELAIANEGLRRWSTERIMELAETATPGSCDAELIRKELVQRNSPKPRLTRQTIGRCVTELLLRMRDEVDDSSEEWEWICDELYLREKTANPHDMENPYPQDTEPYR
jgi:hypothetical protein